MVALGIGKLDVSAVHVPLRQGVSQPATSQLLLRSVSGLPIKAGKVHSAQRQIGYLRPDEKALALLLALFDVVRDLDWPMLIN